MNLREDIHLYVSLLMVSTLLVGQQVMERVDSSTVGLPQRDSRRLTLKMVA